MVRERKEDLLARKISSMCISGHALKHSQNLTPNAAVGGGRITQCFDHATTMAEALNT